jgi:hypothetical protein
VSPIGTVCLSLCELFGTSFLRGLWHIGVQPDYPKGNLFCSRFLSPKLRRFGKMRSGYQRGGGLKSSAIDHVRYFHQPQQ